MDLSYAQHHALCIFLHTYTVVPSATVHEPYIHTFGFGCFNQTPPLHLSYTALPLQFQFIPEAVTVLEGTSTVAVVCIQYVSSEFQQVEQDVVVTLQTQDGSAIGELISMCCCFHLNMPLRAHMLPYLAWHLWQYGCMLCTIKQWSSLWLHYAYAVATVECIQL